MSRTVGAPRVRTDGSAGGTDPATTRWRGVPDAFATPLTNQLAGPVAARMMGKAIGNPAVGRTAEPSGAKAGVARRAAAQIGKRAAFRTAAASATGGTSLVAQAGVRAGLRLARRSSWRRLLVVLLAPAVPVIVFAAVIVMVIAATAGGLPTISAPASVPGIGPTVLDAYTRAAAAVSSSGCDGMRWSILAGVGKVESGNAEGKTVSPNGDVKPRIVGPRLDGTGTGGNTTPVRDTDHGRLDGDSAYDHAVGPMQFTPATWQSAGQDGNGDAHRDPHNIYDAALAAARYLCRGARVDLTDRAQLADAIRRYNNSTVYVEQALRWISSYDQMVQQSPTSVTARGLAIVAAARRWLGTPYSWGGGGPTGPTRGICCSPSGGDGTKVVGFDCSGLTQYAYAQVGIDIGGTTGPQWSLPERNRSAIRIPAQTGIGDLAPGDLVFFGLNPPGGIHHVGIYAGAGTMINSPETGDVVKISAIPDRGDYAGAVRVQ